MKIDDSCQGALSVGFLKFLEKNIVHERTVLDERLKEDGCGGKI
jgi:hypothetical protein